jgi:ABC-type multidrug transport system permease subunit
MELHENWRWTRSMQSNLSDVSTWLIGTMAGLLFAWNYVVFVVLVPVCLCLQC